MSEEKIELGQSARKAWFAYSKHVKVLAGVNPSIPGTSWSELSQEERLIWEAVATEVVKNCESEIINTMRAYEVLDRNFNSVNYEERNGQSALLEALISLGKARERVWADILKILGL